MDFHVILYQFQYIKNFCHIKIPDIPDIFAGTDSSGISNFTVYMALSKIGDCVEEFQEAHQKAAL